MPGLFIASSETDAAAAARLAKAAAREGYEPADEAGGAGAVIVLWSETAVRSERMRAEAERARGAGTLVQASADGRRPPMPFNQLQFASLAGWQGEAEHPGWAKVRESLAGLLSR